VTGARRLLRYWLLTALLERGVDPALAAARHHWQRAHRVRPLSPQECRDLLGPYARLRFLPHPRPGPRAAAGS
jgi:hypothetical protein